MFMNSCPFLYSDFTLQIGKIFPCQTGSWEISMQGYICLLRKSYYYVQEVISIFWSKDKNSLTLCSIGPSFIIVTLIYLSSLEWYLFSMCLSSLLVFSLIFSSLFQTENGGEDNIGYRRQRTGGERYLMLNPSPGHMDPDPLIFCWRKNPDSYLFFLF